MKCTVYLTQYYSFFLEYLIPSLPQLSGSHLHRKALDWANSGLGKLLDRSEIKEDRIKLAVLEFWNYGKREN